MLRRMGRPKKPAAERRGQTIRVLVTAKEKRLLAAGARRQGQSLSDWMRATALRGLKDTTVPGTTADDARLGGQS